MKQLHRVFFTFSIIVFLLICINPIGAQNWDWVEQISGENNIQIEGLVKSSSNTFSTGIFEGTATFLSSPDPENNLTTTQFGGFVLCHNQSGELTWANVIEATSAIQIKGITIDDVENVYITGSYSGTSATFHSQNSEDNILLGASQNHDTFIAKYDNNGNLLWAGVVAQSSALDRGFGIQTDTFGNIYIGGFWKGGDLNFTSSSISIPYNSTTNWGNGFIAKFSSDFIPLWVSTIVGGTNEGGVARVNGGIALSNNNGIYASGPFQKTVYFDKTYFADGTELVLPETTYTAGTTIAQDVIAFKLNSDGSFGWARHISNTDKAGNSGNYINSNRDNGDVYFIGNFVGTITIQNESSADPVLLSSNGGEDNYIIKYNNDGIIDWAYSFGGLSNEGINDISHSNDIVTASGYFSGSVYLGSSIGVRDTLVSAGGTDAFIINLSNSGNYLSSTNLRGTLNEDMLCLDNDNFNNVSVGGYFSSPNFSIGGNDLINGGLADGFLAHHINIHIIPTISEISCSEGHDGTLGLEVFGGGQEPYSYVFSLVGGNEIDAGVYSAPLSFTDLVTGAYRFTVTDDLGRTVTKYYHLIAPEPIEISGAVTDVSGCYGNENGSITLTVTGGVGEYTYFWDTPDGYGIVPDAQSQSSLTAGNYMVTVTDENGCFATETFEITQPLQINFEGTSLIGNTSTDALSPNGSIDLFVNNGTEPFNFTWKGPNGFESTNEDLTDIRGGTYILSINDANGCYADTSFNLSDEYLFNAWITETTNPKCKGGSDGSATVEFENATGGISITWSNGQNDVITASGLSAGEYSVTLIDDMGTPSDTNDDVTISLMPVLIGEPAFALSATATLTKTTCPSSNDGAIQLTVNGWSQPYDYSWSTTEGSGLIDGQKDQYDLTVGTYTYAVTDKYGCIVGSSVNLSSNYAAPSFTLDVSPNSEICEGTEVVVSVSEGYQYQFFIDEVSQGEFSTINTLAIPSPTDGMVVRVVGMNIAGCTNENEAVITVNPIPTPVIGTNDPIEWTEGETISVLFTVDIETADSYQWLLNGEPIVDAISDTYTANQEGTFSAEVTVLGCLGLSNEIAITVVPLETYTVTFTVTNSSQVAVENADITVTGYDVITTNASGEATIDLPNGTYTFEVTANDYQLYSGGFEVNGANVPVPVQLVGVGIDPNQLLNVSAYPNPFSNHLNIVNADVVKRVVISNITGQKVIDVALDGENEVSTQSLQSGVYIVTLVGHNGKTAIYKMIKE